MILVATSLNYTNSFIFTFALKHVKFLNLFDRDVSPYFLRFKAQKKRAHDITV